MDAVLSTMSKRKGVVVDETQAKITDIVVVPVSISANAADGLENSLP